MPDKPIFYQWQNETLLKTIYPLREMKLRDFLVFYNEIDVWKDYKDLSLEDLQDQIDAHRENLTRRWAEAYDAIQGYKEDFIKPTAAEDYRQKYPDIDAEVFRRSTLLFNTFKTYFPRIRHVQNERYFVTQRIREWETTHKWVTSRIDRHQRNLSNMGPTWVHKAAREKELAQLESSSLPMVNEVLEEMYAFLSAMVKIEKQRVELKKFRDSRQRDKAQITRRREQAVRDLQKVEVEHGKATETFKRFQNPPDLAALEAYFAKPDVSPEYQTRFGGTDPDFTSAANKAHNTITSYFKTVTNGAQRLFFLRGQTSQIDQHRRSTERRIDELERNLRNMGPTWSHRADRQAELEKLRTVTLPMVSTELARMEDLKAALENAGKSAAQMAQARKKAEQDFSAVDARLKELQGQASDLESELKLLEIDASKSEKEQLLKFLEAQPITKNDIVIGKIDEYRQSLEGKDQYELLELIIERFQKEPKRYPAWLQYMVIHFSGMRYKSAHGSWADPKDLLLSLRIKDIEGEIKRADDEAIEALCEEKLEIYDPEAGSVRERSIDPQPAADAEKPLLASAEDDRWQNKIEYHVRYLKSPSPYTRRQSLMNLRIDEEDYAIESMTSQEALTALEEMKDDFPEWMWKEIVRLTNLRVKEVSDPNWETMTQDEQDERWEYQWREFRQIMDKWKSDNLTNWRPGHDRTKELIVTRAVCNEVAEHIQHLRGQSPPGGLTAKPEWYRRKESDPKLAAGPDKPFLIKPRSPEDFKPGSSILWLRFVHGKPNQWRIAHPITVHGEGLLSPGLIGGHSRAGRPPNPNEPGAWNYTQDSSAIRRRGHIRDAKGNMVSTEQWLRWIHEATVVEVAETAEGTVVLTFETALPYEDRRRSTIGVFKHHINAVRHNVTPYSFIASFVGYVPEAEVPPEPLQAMLDWNKVLLKGYVSDAEMRAYQRQVGITGMRSLDLGTPGASLYLEAAPAAALAPSRASVREGGIDRDTIRRERLAPDVIRCFTVDPGARTAEVYIPEVDLHRGMLMKVDITQQVKAGDEIYYPVTECEGEPRAIDLYVRKSEVIDITQEREPLKLQLSVDTAPVVLAGQDSAGQPVFEDSDRVLPAGTELRLSSLHTLDGTESGDGIIGPDAEGHTYRLILDCPGRSSVNGMFVRSDQLAA